MSWHLAQVNVGRLVAPADDPRVAGFFALLDEVNAAADRAPGFVWRLQTETGNATDVAVPGDERAIVNLSVWESLEALRDYVYAGLHLAPLRRRGEWFERMDEAHLALWWIPRGTTPGVDEAVERLERLRREGPGPQAFTFASSYPAPAADP